MRDLLRLDPFTRKICMSVETGHCCGDVVTEKERFRIDVIQEGCCDDPLFVYDIFDVSPDGDLCILLDGSMLELCPGRYIFRLVFDECEVISDIRFIWGSKPVLKNVSCERSKLEDCYPEHGESCDENQTSLLPDACCDPCDSSNEDPCAKFNPDCSCGTPDCGGCLPERSSCN